MSASVAASPRKRLSDDQMELTAFSVLQERLKT
jgi:hypothetical protein